MNEKSLIFLTFEQIRDILRVRDFTFYKEKMSEALTLSKGFDEMGKSIKEKVKSELEALNTKISKGSKNLSEESTTNEILSQLQNKELDELKNSLLRNTAIQMKLKELNYNVWTIDGIYGNQTWQAVKQFQKNNKVEGSKKRNGEFDGIAGKETMNKMLKGNLQKWEEVSNKKEKQTSNKAVERENQNERKEKGAKGEVYTVKRLEKFEDLPKGYTWKDDSIKYEIANPTDPKRVYRFYSNGKFKSPYDGKFYLTKGLILAKSNKKNEKDLQSKQINQKYHEAIKNDITPILKTLGLSNGKNTRNNLIVSIPYGESEIKTDISRYCDDRGNISEPMKNRLKQDLQSLKIKKEKEKQNKSELKKAEEFFKQKSYWINDFLFSETLKNQFVKGTNILKMKDRKYIAFYNSFTNSIISFKKDASKIEWDNLILELDLNTKTNYSKIKIPLWELWIDRNNYTFWGKSNYYNQLEFKFRKALSQRIENIVERHF